MLYPLQLPKRARPLTLHPSLLGFPASISFCRSYKESPHIPFSPFVFHWIPFLQHFCLFFLPSAHASLLQSVTVHRDSSPPLDRWDICCFLACQSAVHGSVQVLLKPRHMPIQNQPALYPITRHSKPQKKKRSAAFSCMRSSLWCRQFMPSATD